MKRRDALKTAGAITGYTLIFGGIATTINACKADPALDWQPAFFTNKEARMIAEIVERIIPRTDTPGAKDAMVDRFIDENIDKNFTIKQQGLFVKALEEIEEKTNNTYRKTFIEISDEEKDNILTELATEAQNHKGETPHIFTILRDMTTFGFFTSEVGAKECLVYDPIPTEYIGCIDYSEVNGAWAF